VGGAQRRSHIYDEKVPADRVGFLLIEFGPLGPSYIMSKQSTFSGPIFVSENLLEFARTKALKIQVIIASAFFLILPYKCYKLLLQVRPVLMLK
jgi:hypothetical protein